MNKKLLIGSAILMLIVCYGSCNIKGLEYYQPRVLATHSNGDNFVGSTTCMECHADIYENHQLTPHNNTSAIASKSTIKGSLASDANTIQIEGGQIEMKKVKDGYYQEATVEKVGAPSQLQKMDIVIGSGIKGQSFVTWEEDEKLYQLQASYYPPTDQWINSPGYPNQLMKRPIRDGCLKCHVTFASNKDFSGKGNRYDRDHMIYGIGCEKCHNPAEEHVVFHREHPEVKISGDILMLDTLSRQHRLDVCAQCHSGPRAGILQGNSFSYLSGKSLNEYSRNYFRGQKNSDLDVHGNQYGLLTSSQCFIKSPEMDCSTCHDPHKNQRGDTNYFNSKCKDCHNSDSQHCSGNVQEIDSTNNNCISCHMPTVQSKSMTVQLSGDNNEQSGVLIRTHAIGIYSSIANNPNGQIDSTSASNIKGFIKNL